MHTQALNKGEEEKTTEPGYTSWRQSKEKDTTQKYITHTSYSPSFLKEVKTPFQEERSHQEVGCDACSDVQKSRGNQVQNM